MLVNDAEYVFQQDIREKKSAGRGIYHKKNGSKTKKCSLPSDYMTKRERNKMNSEVITWDMRKLYTYAEFKKMPDDLKVDYINGLITRYSVSMTNIAEELFNISPNGFWTYMQKHGGHEKLIKAKRGKVTSKEALSKFQDDILKSMEPDGSEEDVTQRLASRPLTNHPEDNPAVKDFIDKLGPVEEPKVDPKQHSLVYACLSTKGFDKDLFDYLASKYGDAEIVVTITVSDGKQAPFYGGGYIA